MANKKRFFDFGLIAEHLCKTGIDAELFILKISDDEESRQYENSAGNEDAQKKADSTHWRILPGDIARRYRPVIKLAQAS